MPIDVAPGIRVPDAEYSLSFVRASGPGGQNVNKVSSAVQLRFDLAGTRLLPESARRRARALAGQKLNIDGSILIVARSHRSQEQNRRDAEGRLADLLRAALVEPRKRLATKPTRASRQRRLEGKALRGVTKRGRSRVSNQD